MQTRSAKNTSISQATTCICYHLAPIVACALQITTDELIEIGDNAIRRMKK